MIQIFILGASTVYGVGGKEGGWADLIKRSLHAKMYAPAGTGERYEVYNFGKSGARIDFVQRSFPEQVQQYGRGGKIITIISVGGNNSKAENEPNAVVSSIGEYSKEMSVLLDMLKEKSTHVIAVGSGYYDESKTNPKLNPLTGGRSYFTNKRREEYEQVMKQVCAERGIPFIGVDVSSHVWKNTYQYRDGLHPNDRGHERICANVLKVLEQFL
ncbi:MAG: SGNH/GDSL hydrolase family protein [bacterium]|nr:SGNH/GDSL hydrolase family protein [bacterium]